MKKLVLSLVFVLLVGAVGWLGASWWIGQQTEALLRKQLEQANQNANMQGVKQELVSYEGSLLGAKAVTRLQVEHPVLGKWLNNLQIVHDIQNGPMMLRDGMHFGLSHWQSRLDMASLDEQARKFMETAFAGKEPLTAVTDIGFDQMMRTTMDISPLDAALGESGAALKMAGAQISGEFNVDKQSGPVKMNIGAVEWRDQDMTLSLPSVELQGHAEAEGVGAFAMKAADIKVLPAGETNGLQFDLNMESDSAIQEGSVQGKGKFQVSNVRGMDTGFKQFDLTMDYAGLNLEALKQAQVLQGKLQTLQAQMAVDEAATELPEGQKQMEQLGIEAQEVTNQLLDVMLNQVMQAGKSSLRYDLKVALDKGVGSSKVDLLYAGSGKPIQLDDLISYSPQDWGRLLKGSVELAADKAVVPEDLQMMLAYPLAQKAMVEQDGQYRLQLKLSGEQAELNGEAVAFEALPGKFFPQMPAIDENSSMGIPPEIMQRIEQEGMSEELLKELEGNKDIPPETQELLKQLQEMSTQVQ